MTDDCEALEYGATLHRPDPLTLTRARERAARSHKAGFLASVPNIVLGGSEGGCWAANGAF